MCTWEICVIAVMCLSLGYCVGKMHGWVIGYERCSEDTYRGLDDYFEKMERKRRDKIRSGELKDKVNTNSIFVG